MSALTILACGGGEGSPEPSSSDSPDDSLSPRIESDVGSLPTKELAPLPSNATTEELEERANELTRQCLLAQEASGGVITAGDVLRLSCQVEAFKNSVFGLSVERCQEEATTCLENAEPPSAAQWSCQYIGESLARASSDVIACSADWVQIFEETVELASCTNLANDPLSLAKAASQVALLVNLPGAVEPESCNDSGMFP